MTLEEQLDQVEQDIEVVRGKPLVFVADIWMAEGARIAILNLKNCVAHGALVDAYRATLKEL